MKSQIWFVVRYPDVKSVTGVMNAPVAIHAGPSLGFQAAGLGFRYGRHDRGYPQRPHGGLAAPDSQTPNFHIDT